MPEPGTWSLRRHRECNKNELRTPDGCTSAELEKGNTQQQKRSIQAIQAELKSSSTFTSGFRSSHSPGVQDVEGEAVKLGLGQELENEIPDQELNGHEHEATRHLMESGAIVRYGVSDREPPRLRDERTSSVYSLGYRKNTMFKALMFEVKKEPKRVEHRAERERVNPSSRALNTVCRSRATRPRRGGRATCPPRTARCARQANWKFCSVGRSRCNRHSGDGQATKPPRDGTASSTVRHRRATTCCPKAAAAQLEDGADPLTPAGP